MPSAELLGQDLMIGTIFYLSYFLLDTTFKRGRGANFLTMVFDKSASLNSPCSLSLWRVVRGSKLTHLEIIHDLFIT
jgi:hypothetical protein